MISIVAGGAGFIGVNLVKNLLLQGKTVFIGDNFSGGSLDHLASIKDEPNLHIESVDLSLRSDCDLFFKQAANYGKVSEVWHLAANSDIAKGVENPDIDLKDTFLSTFEILRNMRLHSIKKILFASSSAVYGDWGGDIRLTESFGPLIPISNYGAMKLASEASIMAATESFLDEALIFRFPNVIGVPATHGVIYDLIRKLKSNNKILSVLGNGTQQKPYLHVSDLIDAMTYLSKRVFSDKVTIVNLGPEDEGVSVKFIAENVVSAIFPDANIEYGHGGKGWVGDVPKFNYCTDFIRSIGWRPSMSSSEAVCLAILEIKEQLGNLDP